MKHKFDVDCSIKSLKQPRLNLKYRLTTVTQNKVRKRIVEKRITVKRESALNDGKRR
jgi:hypothetical protein